MKQISILGCGWLGLPLAKALLKKNHLIKGSTTSFEKIKTLEKEGIIAFQIAVRTDQIEGDMVAFLKNTEILIIDIPPKLRGLEKENFVAKIRNLIPFIEKAGIKKVLFVSSTSVYADDNSVVSENTISNPSTESGKQLLLSEQYLKKNFNFKTTIVRFGGLVAENRHPILFLAGKENVENPDGAINLIHREDCIGIILKIIETDIWSETFNAVAPFHPSRINYYTQKAVAMNLDLPKFNHKIPSVGKTVISNKIVTLLNYNFVRTNDF